MERQRTDCASICRVCLARDFGSNAPRPPDVCAEIQRPSALRVLRRLDEQANETNDESNCPTRNHIQLSRLATNIQLLRAKELVHHIPFIARLAGPLPRWMIFSAL